MSLLDPLNHKMNLNLILIYFLLCYNNINIKKEYNQKNYYYLILMKKKEDTYFEYYKKKKKLLL